MDDLKNKYLGQIADAGDENALEAIRLAAVGKKGEVALKMRELGKMTPEERQTAGPALNALKDEINSALAAKKAALADAALDERLRSEWLDVTLPGRNRPQGTLHPVSQVTEELTAIFAEMGSEEVTRRIAETRALAQSMQISGTPTFIVGDEMVRGYLPLEGMRDVVEEQRGEG